jgi:predicted SAM-dependent methyltransferase
MHKKYINAYAKRFYRLCSTIGMETTFLILSAVGVLKTRLFFDKNNTNRLEIGVGSGETKPGFITLDLNLKADYPFDLRMGLPFPDQSIDFIYAEHVLEHFGYYDVILIVRECYRVLKDGGVFSSVFPDTRIWIDAYQSRENLDLNQYCIYKTGLSYKSKIDYLNYAFYMGGCHRHMFDVESVGAIFTDAGFREVRQREFDPGLDQQRRQATSFYMESVR